FVDRSGVGPASCRGEKGRLQDLGTQLESQRRQHQSERRPRKSSVAEKTNGEPKGSPIYLSSVLLTCSCWRSHRRFPARTSCLRNESRTATCYRPHCCSRRRSYPGPLWEAPLSEPAPWQRHSCLAEC